MFSVIMPVYNGEKFISDAIESIINQTEKNWELIVVNDGSTDGTKNVLEKYADNDKIKVINQQNGGVSVARNVGVNNAKYDYITFLDADDVWCKNHLSVMASLIEKYPSAGLYASFSMAELVNGDVIEECEYFKGKPDDILLEDFFEEYDKDKSAKMFNIGTTCVTKEAFFKAGGFPVGCKIGEDLELSLRVATYYPVALTKIATGVYKKENSTATKEKSFDPNWGFFDGVEELYQDAAIPAEKRENLRRVMQWFSMRRYRHYMIEGERKRALEVYKNTDKRCISTKDRIINRALMLLPTGAIRKIFLVRWRGQA